MIETKNNQEFQVEEVVPQGLPLSDITYKFDSRFIPTSLYQDLLSELMKSKISTILAKDSNSYVVSFASLQSFAITNSYG